MPTSAFSALYPYIRTLLGDTYQVSVYSNDQLDMGIRLSLLYESSYIETTDTVPSGDQLISPPITLAVDKLRFSIRSALALLRPTIDEGSYRTPMLSVSTHASISYNELWELLQQLTSGGINFSVSDNEFDAAFNGIVTVPALLARFGIVNSTLLNWNADQQAFPNG